MKIRITAAAIPLCVVLTLFMTACKSGEQGRGRNGTNGQTIRLTCPAFSDGSPIPVVYTCDGDDFSPPLAWETIPDSTRSFCLICDDPDAPAGTWVHWMLYDLPDTVRELPEAMPKTDLTFYGARQGKNDFSRIGYGGPCPPGSSEHRYYFRIYALDAVLALPAGVNRAALESAMEGHVLGSGQLMGTYKRR